MVNVVARARDIGGIADCTRAHSMKSFLFNAPMSCPMESSRVASGVMVVNLWEGIAMIHTRQGPS